MLDSPSVNCQYHLFASGENFHERNVEESSAVQPADLEACMNGLQESQARHGAFGQYYHVETLKTISDKIAHKSFSFYLLVNAEAGKNNLTKTEENHGVHDQDKIAQEISVDDLHENIKGTEVVENNEKTIHTVDDHNSQPALARMDPSDQVIPEQFRNNLVTEQRPLIQDTFHQLQVPYKNQEMSEKNKDNDRQINHSSHRI